MLGSSGGSGSTLLCEGRVRMQVPPVGGESWRAAAAAAAATSPPGLTTQENGSM